MTQFGAILTISLMLATAAPAMAQQQREGAKKTRDVPADARPPKGMCRIWIDGVPAAQQPAATDCPSAVKNRPANGTVLFGNDVTDSSKTKTVGKPKLPPDAKGFTNVKPLPRILPKRPPQS